MKKPTQLVFAFVGDRRGDYRGHAILVWQADGSWHYRAALAASGPLPAVGAGGFKTAGQATDAAMAFVDGLHSYHRLDS
jgi:hypothetical protein